MELYADVSQRTARLVTKAYSTSFNLATRLFAPKRRTHIYNIYGMVRIADEIVDTYKGKQQATLLDEFEHQVTRSLSLGYDTNPIIYAFCLTARRFDITTELTKPFFASMRTDLTKKRHNNTSYSEYIYGSAEVVGLMCLKVFMEGNTAKYNKLKPGAQALGAAFQKVNFLRDLAGDTNELGRMYFPNVNFDAFSSNDLANISQDIEHDFSTARTAIHKLPPDARRAVSVAYAYYYALFKKISNTSPAALQQKRIRIADSYKLLLILRIITLDRLGWKV